MQRLQNAENTKRLEYKSTLTNTIQTTLYDTEEQSSWKMHCNMTNSGNKVFLYYVLTTWEFAFSGKCLSYNSLNIDCHIKDMTDQADGVRCHRVSQSLPGPPPVLREPTSSDLTSSNLAHTHVHTQLDMHIQFECTTIHQYPNYMAFAYTNMLCSLHAKSVLHIAQGINVNCCSVHW